MPIGSPLARLMNGLRSRLIIGVALGVLGAAASPALAQFRPGMGRMAEPDVTSEEIGRIAEMLGFSEDQRLVADQLHAAYLAELAGLAEEVGKISDAAREEFRDSRDPTVWRDFADVMRGLEERKDALADGFLSDLRLVLTTDQDTQWASVERFHRRFSSMGREGLVSGEGVDLIDAVRTLELPQDAASKVQPLLSQYEVEVDRALIQRNRAYEEGLAQGRALMFERNFEEMEKLFEAARDAATRVREVNQRFSRQVLSLLETEQAARLQREIDRRSFPQVYRPTYAQRAFEAAAGFEGLSPEQAQRLADLRVAFDRDLEAANRRLADAILESEKSRSVRAMFGWGRGPRGGGDQEPTDVRQARQAKLDLESRMVERLRDTLGPDLASRLPEREGMQNWREQTLSPQ